MSFVFDIRLFCGHVTPAWSQCLFVPVFEFVSVFCRLAHAPPCHGLPVLAYGLPLGYSVSSVSLPLPTGPRLAYVHRRSPDGPPSLCEPPSSAHAPRHVAIIIVSSRLVSGLRHFTLRGKGLVWTQVICVSFLVRRQSPPPPSLSQISFVFYLVIGV